MSAAAAWGHLLPESAFLCSCPGRAGYLERENLLARANELGDRFQSERGSGKRWLSSGTSEPGRNAAIELVRSSDKREPPSMRLNRSCNTVMSTA